MHSLSLSEKARMMSIIPQDVTLFNRSIHENATYEMAAFPITTWKNCCSASGWGGFNAKIQGTDWMHWWIKAD